MNITKSYIEGVKARVELVRKSAEDKRIGYFEMHVWNLLDYLSGLDYFLEEEKNLAGTLPDTAGTTKDIAGGNLTIAL